MADIHLTNGNDVYAQPAANKGSYDNVFGEEGNDTIRLYQGTAIGGPGNDVFEIIPVPGEPWRELGVAYWNSPKGIVANLEEGWADDGFGGRDTFIGVQRLHGSANDDKFTGNAKDNFFHPNGGHDVIDGRGGNDGVDVREIPPNADGSGTWRPATLADLDVVVSPDGRAATITVKHYPKIQYTLNDIEYLRLMNDEASYPLASFIKPQDMAQQAIAAGGSLRWNASSALGTSVNVSFSFVTNAPADGVGAPGFRAFTAAEQQAVRDLLGKTSALVGIGFTEVAETGGSVGQLRFGVSSQANTKGQSWQPNQPGAGELAGDVWMDSDSMIGLAPGTEGYMALLHEVGHALGLRHPRNVDAGDAWAVQLRAQDDQSATTVMSEALSADGLFRSEWSGLDVLALRYLYGARPANVGDTVYALGQREANAQTTLVDDGGMDTLDASALPAGVSLDLAPGHMSSAGLSLAGVAAVDNLAMTVTTVIENAIGSAFDDVLLGNSSDNLLSGGRGNDWIDGATGKDTASFAGLRSDYEISTGYGKVYVKGRDGKAGFDTLVNIERLQFADQVVTLSPAVLAADTLLSVDEDSALTALLPSPTDVDRSAVSYRAVGLPAHGTLSLSAQGSISYTPAPNYHGADAVAFDIVGTNGSNRYEAYITVLPVNDAAPVARPGDYLAIAGTTLRSHLPAATDVDQDSISYALRTDPANGSIIVASTGDFSYQPKAGFAGTDNFSFTISDGMGGSTNYSAKVAVTAVNQLRTGTNQSDILGAASSSDGYLLLGGNDRATGGGGDDAMDGGDGLDTAVYTATRASYNIAGNDFWWSVNAKTGNDGNDRLIAVERLQFSDRMVALDLNGSEHGGQAAQIIRALFGSATLKVPEYTGYGVVLLDQGMSYLDLVNMAVHTDAFWSLAGDLPAHSNTAFVNAVYKNVTGRAASGDELKYYVDLLDAGVYTHTTLGLAACQISLNTASADLVGLAAIGLDYLVPPGLG